MKQEEFEAKAKSASKEMLKKKAPTRPETQFVKGALWAWDLLTQGRTVAEYEEQLRQDVCARFNIEEPERWQELLISETATMMADRDGMQHEPLQGEQPAVCSPEGVATLHRYATRAPGTDEQVEQEDGKPQDPRREG